MKDEIQKMNEYIKSDLYRYTGKTDLISFIKQYFNNKTPFRLQVAFRMCNSKKKSEKLIGNLMWLVNRQRKIVQIPRHMKIGYRIVYRALTTNNYKSHNNNRRQL